jgi:hypothetical protein
MKKNWISIASLVLNVVLLAGLFWVGSEVKELRRETTHLCDQFNDEIYVIRNQMSDIRATQREQIEFVEEFRFEPTGLNQETKQMEGTMTLSLRRWAADTAVTLLAELNGEPREIPMIGENGTFKTTVGLPVTGQGELVFTALITSQGETSREHMTGYGDFSMLLPLQTGGGGWDGPVYQNGILSSQFHITIDGQDNKKPGAIENPEFRIYRNGELVQTFGAVIDPTAGSSSGFCYTVDTEDYRWGLECDEGDVIEIRFLCQDEFGLSYDWLFAAWTPEGETPENHAAAGAVSGLGALELTWPE